MSVSTCGAGRAVPAAGVASLQMLRSQILNFAGKTSADGSDVEALTSFGCGFRLKPVVELLTMEESDRRAQRRAQRGLSAAPRRLGPPEAQALRVGRRGHCCPCRQRDGGRGQARVCENIDEVMVSAATQHTPCCEVCSCLLLPLELSHVKFGDAHLQQLGTTYVFACFRISVVL